MPQSMHRSTAIQGRIQSNSPQFLSIFRLPVVGTGPLKISVRRTEDSKAIRVAAAGCDADRTPLVHFMRSMQQSGRAAAPFLFLIELATRFGGSRPRC